MAPPPNLHGHPTPGWKEEAVLDTGILLVVLATALMHASWNAMVRASGDKLVSLANMTALTALIGLPLIFFVPLPSREVWALLALTTLLHTGYKIFLVRAYAHGGLGHVYPLARGGAPLLVAGAGFGLLGETMSPASLAGMLLVTLGIISLAFRKNGGTQDEKRATLYALITAGFIASYTTVDGIGARLAETSFAYVAWLFVLDGAAFTALALWRRGPSAAWSPATLLRQGLPGALLQVVAYALVLWAMTKAPLGLVSAVRETSVVFAALISSLILKEKLGPMAAIAALAVAAGVILIEG